MEEVKVYMIANLQIHDADRYREYEKGFFPILKKINSIWKNNKKYRHKESCYLFDSFFYP